MDALLAATQLTSVQLASVWCLHSSATQAPCSWQWLELSGCIDCYSAAYLPLHSLTQPRLVARLCVSAAGGSNQQMAAAVHNLTQTCKVPVEFKAVELDMLHTSLSLHQLVDTLQPPGLGVAAITIQRLPSFSSADIHAQAPLCQACTRLNVQTRSLDPSLQFWHQLVQLMPMLTHVSIECVDGAAVASMSHVVEHVVHEP
ncbi:hypothetical protein QJQ45_005470 [Haematococcus lacustris]|nr:hypothetical protein QJQ45_005470 [Haematococcus lacustris]